MKFTFNPLPKMRALWLAYLADVREKDNEPRLISALSFLLCFALVRTITMAIREDKFPVSNIKFKETHIHHIVPGMGILLAVGVLDLLSKWPNLRALLFGSGAALAIDEFALLVHLADVYWEPEGQISINVFFGFAGILAIILLGGDFWKAAWQIMTRHKARELKRIKELQKYPEIQALPDDMEI